MSLVLKKLRDASCDAAAGEVANCQRMEVYLFQDFVDVDFVGLYCLNLLLASASSCLLHDLFGCWSLCGGCLYGLLSDLGSHDDVRIVLGAWRI